MQLVVRFICLVVCLTTAQYSNAQTEYADWRTYLNERSGATADYIYISDFKNNKPYRHLYCFKDKGQQVLAMNLGDTLFTEINILQPDLFKHVKGNRNVLIAVRHHQTKNRNKKAFDETLTDKEHFIQLGIKIKGLHYNHYRRVTREYIAGLKKEKLRKGYKLVNDLMDVLEKSAVQEAAQ